jgi:hypothetical protein
MMNFHEACLAIVDNRAAKALNYAVAYAEVGLGMEMGTDESRVQALYILNNITYWRGDLAKTVRAALKAEGGVK